MSIKAEYNKVLERFHKATTWFDNPNRTQAEIDKYMPARNC